MMVPLEEDEKKRIFDAVPWPHELNMMGEQFKRLDRVAKRDVRRAAYHLLWYGRELCADREPITNDKLQ